MNLSLKLLAADLAFVDTSIIREGVLVPVFPMRKGDGAYRATLDQLLERSRLQSSFVDDVLPLLIAILGEAVPALKQKSGPIVRSVLVTITSLFVDRYLRVVHRLRQLDERIAVVDVAPINQVQWLGEVSHLSNTSWRLNQDIIRRIVVGLGYESVPVLAAQSYPEYPHEYSVPNMLFSPPQGKWTGRLHRVFRRSQSILGAFLNPKTRILSTGFGYDEYYFIRSGLYGSRGLFRRANRPPRLQEGDLNLDLRKNLREKLRPVAKAQLLTLLNKLDPLLDVGTTDMLNEIWLGMLVDWFPLAFLEGLSATLAKVQKGLDLDRVDAIIGADLASDIGVFQCLAARLAGKMIIGVQHSAGQYGYIEDLSGVAHPEYSLYDIMVTLGWSRIDDHLPQCRTLSLPSPRLSEKPLMSDYLRDRSGIPSEKRDILFLSNLFHRFPHISTCGQARVDFIDEIFDSQLELVQTLTEAGLTMDHKPYNKRYIDLYPEHHRQLQRMGGNGYRSIDVAQKGLTVELIKTCRIVLWDQIGSGTVECLTAGVPTIIFWKRIYSREVSWAKGLIDELERCGIVHVEPDELASEIKKFIADPEQWMNDADRIRAVQKFCHSFARTDTQWAAIWKRELSQLLNSPKPFLRHKSGFDLT